MLMYGDIQQETIDFVEGMGSTQIRNVGKTEKIFYLGV